MEPRQKTQTDLEWKRTYLRELEKKRQRQHAALSDTGEELAQVRAEIAELEKLLGARSEDSD